MFGIGLGSSWAGSRNSSDEVAGLRAELAVTKQQVVSLENRVQWLEENTAGSAVAKWREASAQQDPTTPARSMRSYASTSVSAGAAPYAGDTLAAKAKAAGRALGHQIDVQSLHSDCKPVVDQGQPAVGVSELLRFLTDATPPSLSSSISSSAAAAAAAASVSAVKKQSPFEAAQFSATGADDGDDTNKGRRASRDQEDEAVHGRGASGTSEPTRGTKGASGAALLDTLRKLARACQYDDSARLSVWSSGVIQQKVLQILSGHTSDADVTLGHQAAAAALLWYLSRCQALQSLELPGSTNKLDGDMELAHALVSCLETLGHATGKEADEGAYACCMALNNICMLRPVVRSDAIQAGAVVQLATHLGSSTPKIRAAAATALLSLTWVAPEEGNEGVEGSPCQGGGGELVEEQVWDGRKAVQQLGLLPGAVQALASILHTGEPAAQANAAGVLQNMSLALGQGSIACLATPECLAALTMHTDPRVAQHAPSDTPQTCLRVLVNLCMEPACHGALIGAGTIEALSRLVRPQLCALMMGQDQLTVRGSTVDSEDSHGISGVRGLGDTLAALINMATTGKLASKLALVKHGAGAALLLACRVSTDCDGAGPEPSTLRLGTLQEREEEGEGKGATTEGTTGEGDNESEGHHEEEEECDPEPCITPQEVQLYALSGLLHISMEPQAREALLDLPQTCSTLVGVALEGSPDAKERAAKVMANLAISDSGKSRLVAANAAPVLVGLVCPGPGAGTRAGRLAAMRAVQHMARLGKNRRDVADAGGARALLSAICDQDLGIADAAARALFALCNHLEVLEEVIAAGGATNVLTAVQLLSACPDARGGTLLVRLLHRMSLSSPAVSALVQRELEMLGLMY